MNYSNTYIYEIPEIKQIINSYLINENHNSLMKELLYCNQETSEIRKGQSMYIRCRSYLDYYYGEPEHIRYFIYNRGLGIDKKWTNEMTINDY